MRVKTGCSVITICEREIPQSILMRMPLLTIGIAYANPT